MIILEEKFKDCKDRQLIVSSLVQGMIDGECCLDDITSSIEIMNQIDPNIKKVEVGEKIGMKAKSHSTIYTIMTREQVKDKKNFVLLATLMDYFSQKAQLKSYLNMANNIHRNRRDGRFDNFLNTYSLYRTYG